MKVAPLTTTSLLITEWPGLDPIRVFIEDYEPGKGRITIVCFSMAWTAYWGAMSDRSIRQFFADCTAEYLAGNLAIGQYLHQSEHHDKYLTKIVEAVQDALKGSEVLEKSATPLADEVTPDMKQAGLKACSNTDIEPTWEELEVIYKAMNKAAQRAKAEDA